MSVPDLIGMRYAEAKVVLERLGLGVGVLVTEPNFTDTLSGFIQRQVPMPVQGDSIVNRIRTGQLVDLWIGSESARRDSL
jgi:beta-lactam-binding protein with PASTA domain